MGRRARCVEGRRWEVKTVLVREGLKDKWVTCPKCKEPRLVPDWKEYALKLEHASAEYKAGMTLSEEQEIVNAEFVKLQSERDQLRSELAELAKMNSNLAKEIGAVDRELAQRNAPRPCGECSHSSPMGAESTFMFCHSDKCPLRGYGFGISWDFGCKYFSQKTVDLNSETK